MVLSILDEMDNESGFLVRFHHGNHQNAANIRYALRKRWEFGGGADATE